MLNRQERMMRFLRIMEKKLKEDPLFFLLSGKGSPGKSGLDFSMTWRLRLERATQKLLKVLVLEKKKKPFMTTMKTQTIKTESIRKLCNFIFQWTKTLYTF